jgi:hypothetical protein
MSPNSQHTGEALEVTLPFEFSLPGMPFTQLLNTSFTITLPPQNDAMLDRQLPLIFLMHGFNVPPQFYSRLTSDLAKKGYAVVAPDVLQSVNFPIPGLPRKFAQPCAHFSASSQPTQRAP